jgi:hypothetical protein
MSRKIPHGGWCPHGRTAEDGIIDSRYRLRETPSPTYIQRTEWNVRDSDGTVIFSVGEKLYGGSKLCEELARRMSKPCLHISKTASAKPVETFQQFLMEHKIKVLNVAGPRESTEADIVQFTLWVLQSSI